MAKSANQKLKLLYLAKIFLERTDEEHGLSVREIIEQLNHYEISADRKTIYLDFDDLRRFGMDITSCKEGRSVTYRLAGRDFELAELKLLVDSVQSSKFITERKSVELIKKLERLASVYEARQLHRGVVLAGRVKSMNESVYYNVDMIHDAIGGNRKIRFQYFQWNVKKRAELRHDGAFYCISPWALVWNSEYYYLIGYDSDGGMIKHYRVDKMLRLEITQNERDGREVFETLNLADYSNGLFSMFGGESEDVTLLCANDMAGAIIDRFGKGIRLVPVDEGHFSVCVRVTPSEPFWGWVISLGDGVKITAPESLVERMRAEIRRILGQYSPI